MNTEKKSVSNNRIISISYKALSIILCVFVIFTFTACRDSSMDESVAGIEYYHYNTTDFNHKCDKLKKLAQEASGKDTKDITKQSSNKVIQLYDQLYNEYEEIDSLYAVIYVKYSTNMSNQYYTKEQQYSYNTLIKSQDRFCNVCRRITNSPYADSFQKHIGNNAFKSFANYQVMTKEEKELVNRDKKLIDKYYKTIENASYTYKDKKWYINDILSDKGEDLAVTNYEDYIKIYDGIINNANKKAGPIYIELVDIRDRLAEIQGFDSFADYADSYEYNRSYTEEDLESLYADVKEISSDFYDNYYSTDMDGTEASVPPMSQHKLLKTLEKYSGKISNISGDASKTLVDENLYSLGDAEFRQDGAFTTYISNARKPFISMTLDHTTDFVVLTHEFGHFAEYYYDGNNSAAMDKYRNLITDTDNIDLSEIASNGFEGLMTHYYSDIFGKNKGELATEYVALDLLQNVIEGCMYDEFQREVYANPDMTLKEINETFAEIESEYDHSIKDDEDGFWVYISHNFEAPMYYISYSTSGLAALQIWNMSQNDFDKAVNAWENIVKEGTYNKDYLEVLKKCNLKLFTEDGVVKEICKPAIRQTQPEKPFNYEK